MGERTWSDLGWPELDRPGAAPPRPVPKPIRFMTGEDVEPDEMDPLEADLRLAEELYRDVWCPTPMKERLREYQVRLRIYIARRA
jgi:hypothetical protein